MIQFPRELPCALRDGYGFKPVSPIMSTDMQTGRARHRRKYSSTPTVTTVNWLFNDAEAQLFESWFEEVLISGSQWFECDLKSPQGFQSYKARFVDIYEGPTLDGISLWRYRAQLELWERPILTGGWAIYAPEYIVGMNLLDLAINKDWPQ